MAATVSFPTLATKVDIEQWVLLNQCKQGKARFRDFCEYAWPVVEPAMDFVPNWHIDAICDHLQAVADGQIRRLLINVPPGHAKSLLVSVLWPAWMWIRNPEGAQWRGLFASYTRDLAVRDSLRCRDLMGSPWYRQTYQPKWEFSRVQDQKGQFANSEQGFRISLGVGGAGTGFRGDCVVADDPINAIDQYSDAMLESCLLWWDSRRVRACTT